MDGSEIRYAIKKATTWNTAVACGANNGFYGLPNTIARADSLDVDNSLGSAYSLDGTRGAITCNGTIPLYLRFDGCDEFLAGVMGSAGVPTTHTGGTLSKDFVYDFADKTDGIFWTLVKRMGTAYCRELPGLKLSGFTLQGDAGKPLQLTVDAVGTNWLEDGTNSLTSFNANVTFRETANRIRFGQGVYRLNAQSGAALSSGDAIKPTGFTLSVKRKLTGVYGSVVSAQSQDVIDEPTNDGLPEITLTLKFPRHTAKTYLTAIAADSRYKADLTFTGAVIEGAIPRLLLIQLPHLQLRNVNAVDAAGLVTEDLEFVAYGATTAPTGMTGVTRPLRISGTNSLSTNPLA